MTEPETSSSAGERWLAAAASGGLPEPGLSRWQPLRVGLVNLWEYDRAEFWFADGRLVLRGGNGAGKTKVLELTTLMLLRGEIFASVLDPFGSQHRTMRYNLLPTGDGDDPRGPADSGLGYAWVEFGHRDEHGDCHYFTCGLGASARRGAGTATVQTWQFITALRPGRDLLLSTADRPVEQKELKRINGVTVLDNATHYRARLAAELFGLDTDAYDNLTELLKQLRRPKLGERLNPTSLAETLRDALPPLASNEINQLADGWDRLELLRKAVEQTKESAKQLAQFVRTGWRPWASAVGRRRADRLSSATTALDDTTKARRAAEERLSTAEAEVHRVEAELGRQHRRRTDLDTELRELLNTPAFQEALGAAQRVESLKETLAGLGEQLARTRVRTDESRGAFDRATDAHAKARSAADESTNAVLGSAGAAEAEAGTAGLLASAKRHLPDRDVASLRGDLDRRQTRFARLRSLEREFAEARSEAERAGQLVRQRSEERERAARAEREAATAVELAVDTVRARIRDWAEDAVVAAPAQEQVEDWCDLVAELTAARDDAEQVSPYAVIRSHVDGVRSRLQLRRADLLRQRDPLDSERRDKRRELEKVSGATEAPPPEPLLWRRRTRPELSAQAGAPFWRCVQPAQGSTLSDEALARLEAVLAAAGLLDAWLTVDGRLTTVDGSEIFLGSSGVALGHDLGAVLEPTPAGGVANDVVSSVLRGVGWRDTRPTDDGDAWWLAEDGAWRLGPLTGHAEPAQPASYLGATAREAARQRRIEHLRSRLAELDALIDELDTALAEVDSQLSELDTEAGRVPSERSVREAVAVLTERRERLVAVDDRLEEAREHHLERELARDSAWAGFAEYAGEHAFPTRELDTVAEGLARYRDLLRAFESAIERLAFREEALRSAEEVLETQRRQLEISERQQAELDNEVRRAEVRLRAAEATMDSDHVAQLQHRDRLDVERVELDERLRRLGEENTTAREDKVRAAGTLDTHEQRRREAEAEREKSLAAWWEVVDGGLLRPLELPVPDRRVVETALAGARAARKAIPTPTDDQAEDRAWRRCYAQMNSLRDELLPNRDARVDEELDGGTIQRVLILADSTTGWQSPHDASDTLAARVREQEDNYDGEQQRVLTTLLGSTFIEHLKDRLDYTERTFNDINKQLAGHATRHGHVVRLVWEPDPADPDSGAVVAALGHGYQQLGAERQEMVRSFLARKIDTAREEAAADGAVDWKDQLSAALDYRGWLRISLQYRPGTASGWVPFDAARHAAKSGGEKVVLLSQPLFAAAVVAYNAAGEHAPRWVWLDEAMTGVDAGIKASFMGLTVDFDLDVMLTAHDEWCNYLTVPAVAVYDLARQEHLPGVDAMPWLWCGGSLRQVDMLEAKPASERELVAEGLFAQGNEG